ncbi:MAG: iron-containing alcohol dehydrogenase [Flavobacteriaceae bacterium]|jgi:alcohol dehydrogenase class IV|nr:iron-containing alcohol dehydrogenase [Flavobacteriaceae bacterium]MBT5506576.1 iron-containing alcohol dehydrogenase [Flammeovirgaceae bacterium]MDG1028866.1 iron-containing alcohol dehydrogenase [Flavobacteriaceae bacterium]|tara:strand:+ start:431 stop:1582 length:1152 start_codon:yes stop_codon:yes gene_type:complete
MLDINQVYSFNFPTAIRFGAGVIKELGSYLKDNNLSSPLLVTDPNVAELKFFKEIQKDLEQLGLNSEVYKEMHKNPIKSDVLHGGDMYDKTKRDCIIGIGGGVSLDVARAIVLRVNHKRDLFDYDDLIGGDKYVTKDVPHFITVPTTSGTGSEVGRSAIISEDNSKKKRILFSPKLLARIVFADPLLTMELPSFITAATGMDALTHNMEAYLAKGFHPMCDGIALEGISLISDSLVTATKKPDVESRAKMLLASLMGAVAFQKGLGIVHSLAHPMSSLLDTHHGLANAVNLPYGMEFNYKGFENSFDKMGVALGLGSNSAAKVIPYLFELNSELGLPTRLRDIGVEESHIETLSQLAIEDFCHPSNPKPVTKADFEAIYMKAL